MKKILLWQVALMAGNAILSAGDSRISFCL
jgi:hypothetical protein